MVDLTALPNRNVIIDLLLNRDRPESSHRRDLTTGCLQADLDTVNSDIHDVTPIRIVEPPMHVSDACTAFCSGVRRIRSADRPECAAPAWMFAAMGIKVVRRVPVHLGATAAGSLAMVQDLALGATAPTTGLLTDRFGYDLVFPVGGAAAEGSFCWWCGWRAKIGSSGQSDLLRPRPLPVGS